MGQKRNAIERLASESEVKISELRSEMDAAIAEFAAEDGTPQYVLDVKTYLEEILRESQPSRGAVKWIVTVNAPRPDTDAATDGGDDEMASPRLAKSPSML